MTETRVLAPDEWPIWRELRLRALADAPEAFSSTLEGALARDGEEGPGREAYWRGYFRLPGAAYVAVRDEDGEEVAAGMARLVTTLTPGQAADLFSVWVAPEHRGHGVGHALISACVDHLAAHHPMARLRLAVVETNRPARRLYESCGFGVIGRNPDDDAELLMERRAAPMDQESVELPTELVVRYRAVDREHVGTPTLDTPAHLDRLTELIGREGMRTPIDLAFNEQFATIDGNHRIAVALRLGLATVPVHLTRRPEHPRPGHGKDMDPADLRVLEAALAGVPDLSLVGPPSAVPDRAAGGTGTGA